VSRPVAIALSAFCVATLACNKAPDVAPAAQNTASGADEAALKPAAPQRRPDLHLLVRVIEIQDQSADRTKVVAIDAKALRTEVESALRRVPRLRLDGVPRGETDEASPRPVAETEAALAVDLDWAFIEGRGRAVEKGEAIDKMLGMTLRFVARAHLEWRRGADASGRRLVEKVDGVVEGTVPYRAANWGSAEEFLRVRLVAAAELASVDAVRQAWATGRSDDEILAALDTGDRTTRVASCREAAERGLKGALPGLRKALESSASEVLVCACGALGRLRDAESVNALSARADSADVEVASTAAYALGDIGGAEAIAALNRTAAQHPSVLVRLKASEALHRARLEAVEKARHAAPQEKTP